MKTFKEYIENPLNEASKSDFTAGYEKSKFGGYRAEARNRSGKVSYLGQTAYKTPEAAKGEAEVYIKVYGETGGNDRKVTSAVAQYQKQNSLNEKVVRNSNNKLHLESGGSGLEITIKGNNVNIFLEEGGGETMFAGKADDLKALKEFFSKL